MNELEFRKRVYANPQDPGREALDAAAANPDYREILDWAQQIDRDVSDLIGSLAVPAGLAERLLAIPDQTSTDASVHSRLHGRRSTRFLQYYAVAACLVLTVGVLIGLIRGGGADPMEAAMGRSIVQHMYDEEIQVYFTSNDSPGMTLSMPAVSQVMTNAGVTLGGDDILLEDMLVRYANPCPAFPGRQTAHLILETADGPLNVIVINDTPVKREFSIGDERFSGRIIPMSRGNLVLVARASDVAVDRYRNVLVDSLEWI